jgi:hypothetical protein
VAGEARWGPDEHSKRSADDRTTGQQEESLVSSPEEPPKEPTAPKGDAANEPGGAPEQAGDQRTSPADAGQPADDQAGSHDQDSAEPELPRLSPIPPGGTTAPPDRERVFAAPGSALPGAPTPADPGAGWQRSTDSSAPAATAPAQPTEEDLRKIRSNGRISLALGILALLALTMLPLSLIIGVGAVVIGIAAGIAAIVMGTVARRLARRASTVSAGAVPGIVLGIVSILISTVAGVFMAVLWTELSTYTSCMERANTHSAENKCLNEFQRTLMERVPSQTR